MSRRERQRRRRRQRGHPAARGLVVTFLVFFAVVGLGVLGVVGWVVSVAESAPSIDELKPVDEGANSIVYAADGSKLGFISSLVLRTPVPDKAIPDRVKEATVAIEDRRFYEHKGVDYEGVVRAAIRNITSHKTVQGGSTLTMQLVRNLYLPDERTQKTFERKIREAKLSEELESKHPGRAGKNWILDRYLNSVPYGTVGGQTAVGIEAASRMYFDKPAKKLTLPETAMLAGLPQAPSAYNPFFHPQDALERRNEVLRAMATAGDLTPARAARAEKAKLGVKPNHFYTGRREQYFFDYVKDQLIGRYGLRTVRQGGLRVYTTIDLKKQQEARKAIQGQLPYSSDPSSAIVTVDPSNGHILAMASSTSYGQTKFNYAAQAHRQPGSAFKVMVLMAALSRGVDPSRTTYVSRPLPAGWLPGYPDYDVSTYEHTYGGAMDLVTATIKSDNTVYAQLDADVGPDAVRTAAYKLGIKSHLDALPAEGLGGLKYGVSPLEMASAYATIANGGWRIRPTAITKVVHPDGKKDDLGTPKRKKEFSDGVTYEATKILKDNIQQGTGTAANYGCPAAGKTGTTSDFKDAWFVGFTPEFSTAVWVGYANPPIPMRSVHGIEVQGGSFPARIWHDYMTTAHGGACNDFPQPTHPFQAEPFFGTYSHTGTSSDQSYGTSPRSYGAGGYQTPKHQYYGGSSGGGSTSPSTPQSTGTGTGTGTGTTGDYTNPNLYQSPPQGPPSAGGGAAAGGGAHGGGHGGGGAGSGQ
jgi:penicillin-binding protein 1A